MFVTVAISRRFGLIQLGTPKRKEFVRHETISSALNDRNIVSCSIQEVRHQKEYEI